MKSICLYLSLKRSKLGIMEPNISMDQQNKLVDLCLVALNSLLEHHSGSMVLGIVPGQVVTPKLAFHSVSY
jgi:hypothetical protein